MATLYPGGYKPAEPAGDVAMVLGPNGGDLIFESGQIIMTPGFRTSALLSLMGGNEDDPGTQDAGRSWWGNLGLPDLDQYRSATGHLLATIPPTSNNLKRIQSATDHDLAFLTDAGAANEVEAEASIPGKNQVAVSARVRADGQEEDFSFSTNWRAQAAELQGVEIPFSAWSKIPFWVNNDRDLFVDNFGRYFLMGA